MDLFKCKMYVSVGIDPYAEPVCGFVKVTSSSPLALLTPTTGSW